MSTTARSPRKSVGARETGLAPRDYAADYFGVTLPTLDRWIAQAKKRGFLRRDWSTATSDTQETE